MRGDVVLGSAVSIALVVLGAGTASADMPYDRKLEQAVMAIVAQKEWKLRPGFSLKDRLALVQFERPGDKAVISSILEFGNSGSSSSMLAADDDPIVQLLRSSGDLPSSSSFFNEGL